MMRSLFFGAASIAVVACGGDAFTSAKGSPVAGVDGGSGGSGMGGRASGGSPAARGTGGANTGGTIGGSGGSSNGGSMGSGGVVGNGGASAGGASGNGGASAGGAMGNGGVSAGGASAGGAAGSGGVSAGGTTGSGGVGAGGGSSGNSGDCRLDGTDCHNGTRCVEVTPGGYRVCAVKYPEATACSTPPVPGECCQTSDCQNGATCYPAPLAPQCGGAMIVTGNVCSSGTCTADSDCGASAICAPAGTFQRKVRMCVPASCRHDADCKNAPNGICAPVSGGCCNDPFGLYCVYPNTGCRQNSDCANQNCEIDQNGASFCNGSPVVCPL